MIYKYVYQQFVPLPTEITNLPLQVVRGTSCGVILLAKNCPRKSHFSNKDGRPKEEIWSAVLCPAKKKLLTCLLGQFEEALPDNEKVKRAGKYVAAAALL